MEIKTKFSVGQDVVLFNGLAMTFDHDEVYAIVIQPEQVEGKEFNPQKKVSEGFAEGSMEMKHVYQLQRHQGLLDENILFESEEACKAYYRKFFSE